MGAFYCWTGRAASGLVEALGRSPKSRLEVVLEHLHHGRLVSLCRNLGLYEIGSSPELVVRLSGHGGPSGPRPPIDVEALYRRVTRALDTVDDQGRKVGDCSHGVYLFYDYDGQPIYVGQTMEQIRVRIRRHLTNQRTDAVAMSVLDPFEVAEIEIWPLWDDMPKDEKVASPGSLTDLLFRSALLTFRTGFLVDVYFAAWFGVFCSPTWLFQGDLGPWSGSHVRGRARRGERCPRRRTDRYRFAMRSAVGTVTRDATEVPGAGSRAPWRARRHTDEPAGTTATPAAP